MKSNQDKSQDLEYFSKSTEGLWVKSVLMANEIKVFYQKRFEVKGMDVCILDAQGEVSDKVSIDEIEYGDNWVDVGSISTGDEILLEMCGIDYYDQLLYGLMRHVTTLISLGYGDIPEDIVESFKDLEKGNFVISDRYRIVESCMGKFEKLDKMCIEMDWNYEKDDFPKGEIVVTNESRFGFELNSVDVLGDFIVSTIPV